MKIAIDTNVIVASLSGWHDAHERAAAAVEKIVAAGIGVIPVAALIEAYSVMTRMPTDFRVTPDAALRMLRQSLEGCELAHLPAEAAWMFLAEAARDQVSGGLIYDAVILESARLAGATRLLTFNNRHFEQLPHEGIEIVVPA